MTRRTAPIPFEPMTVLIDRAEARRDHSKTLRRCAKCLMPETEQTITFNAEGVCNTVSYTHLTLPTIYSV